MFNKKECDKCRKKVNDKYSFCPYCGNSFNDSGEEDWGMLGRNDIASSMNDIKLPMGLNMLFNSLMKSMTKEMEKEFREQQGMKGIKINISSSGNQPPVIKVESPGKEKSKLPGMFSEKKLKEFSSLLIEEPKTNIRRLSKKIVYEIGLPKVKSLEDISITKLETGWEIRAIGKERAYFKVISINLHIINYDFLEEKLVLEFSVK